MMQGSPTFGDGGAFRAIFFEEAQEHLAATEAVLLGLDTESPSDDDLNAIFRAVHSIKGSAAMLGFTDIASLTHVLENLLDLLRKGVREMAKADVDAMLQAGDIVKSQVAHHLGLSDAPPDPSDAESRLRERVAVAGTASASTPIGRRFAVRLGPLTAPIDAPELDMMLAGLGEMGALDSQVVDNSAGGMVCFDVVLEGTEFDLRSVLSLVVPPEQIAVQAHEEIPGAASAPAATPAGVAAAKPTSSWTGEHGDELFVDPEEFRRGKDARARAEPVQAAGASPAGLDDAVRMLFAEEHLADPTPPAPEPGSAGAAPAARAASAERGELPSTPAAYGSASLRVATSKIDLLVNLVGELVITESMLSRQGALFEQQAGQGGVAGLADLARHTRDLQEMVLAIRMVPINDGFARLPRLVRELSARLGKRVELKVSGETTELDRGLIEKIADPLLHLVRNAVDHGLETPDERAAAGKGPVGILRLSASQRGGKVVVEVSDDGRGLDRDLILASAAARGRTVPAGAPDADVWQLLFEAGFSTAREVTDVSGRGVGMDVVKRNILSLGGSVDIASRKGRGVKVTMTVPLTLAIIDAMTVALGEQVYVLPLASVVESRSVAAGDLHALPGERETLSLRGDYLPVLRLANLFPPQAAREHPDAIAVIVEADGTCAAVLVDALVGQQQVVVKNLETNFRKVPGVSGATIMSDGSVALILDVAHLVQMCGSAPAARADRAIEEQQTTT
jgi:two-component system, chemotaxis family, sensor kinase CheA